MQAQPYAFGFDLSDEVQLGPPQVLAMIPTSAQMQGALTTSSLGDSDHSSTGEAPGSSSGPTVSMPQHGGISAIEVARLRAQEHAQKFKGKRGELETSPSDVVQSNGVAKRRRHNPGKSESVQVTAGAQSLSVDPPRYSAPAGVPQIGVQGVQVPDCRGVEDGVMPLRDDNDVKDDRYKRRLALNRESAAVSRVRRRAYIKELEERLACVEAEKHQLVGKLDCMLSQNQAMSKQLSDMFHLVASLHQGQAGQQPL